jgi:hypothetical protein
VSATESPFPSLPDKPRTWNEAAHVARQDSHPEDFGHKDCPYCEEARTQRGRTLIRVRRALREAVSPDTGTEA